MFCICFSDRDCHKWDLEKTCDSRLLAFPFPWFDFSFKMFVLYMASLTLKNI